MPVFNATGGWQSYVVPAGVYWIKAQCRGAGGGDWNLSGWGGRAGRGAIVNSYHQVTPGETLHLVVGIKPGPAQDGIQGHIFGGGGMKSDYGSGQPGGNGGGGSSDIRRGGNGDGNRIVVAGGGGGVGIKYGGPNNNGGDAGPGDSATWGGGGGYNQQNTNGYWNTNPGSWTAGGYVNPDPGLGMNSMGKSGGLHFGGQFGWSGGTGMDNGGGGGGGLYGGGGGAVPDERGGIDYRGGGASGAGGSSRVVQGYHISSQIGNAGNTGNGQITIDPYVPPTPSVAGLGSFTHAEDARYALRVDIADQHHPHPSGTLSVEYQLSQSSTFASGVQSATHTFAAGGTVGKQTQDPTITGTTADQMNFWFTLLKTGTWYFRARVKGNYNLTDSAWSASTSFTVAAYKPPTPSLAFPEWATNNRRAILRIDLKQGHPLGGARTVTWTVHKVNADNTETLVASATNRAFDGASVNGAIATDPEKTAPNENQMDFWFDQPTQGVYIARASSAGTDLTTTDTVSHSWTNAHAPATTVVSPTGSAYVQYGANTPFVVNVTDPWLRDTVTAYQILLENNATGTVVLDTGKVVLSQAAAAGRSTFNVAVPSSAKDTLLRWRVRVWDSTDTPSAYTEYALFTLVDPATVEITSPAEGQELISGVPEFAWTVGLTAGRTLVSSRVTVREADTAAVVWQQTVGAGITTVTPQTTILLNQVAYSVTVSITDSGGLTSQDSNLFSTAYESPDPILYTVDPSRINTDGYVDVDWSNQSPDTRLIAWRVYRRELPGDTWELMTEIADEGVKHWRDYLVRSGSSYMYTVSQLADRSGAILESPVGTRYTQDGPHAEDQINLLEIDNYWIIAPDRPELSLRLPGVVSAGETEEYDSETYTIVGRGRHTDYGDRLGYSGTLEVQIRQPERQSLLRLQIEALRAAQETYYIRTPFGRLFSVSLGNLGWDPLAGTGTMEMGDISIPYEEVA